MKTMLPSRPRFRWPFFLVALGLLAAPARAQSFSWAREIGDSYESAVVADRLGNSYTLSAFSATITVGDKTYTSLGGNDLLLTQYKGDGTVGWVRRIGGPGDERVGDLGLTVDGAGALRLAGSFQSTISFETYGNLPQMKLTSAGQNDVFVAEYYINGSSLWAHRLGGPGNDLAHGLDSDQKHNLYVTGSFTETASFSSGGDVFLLKSSGYSDLFLAKFDTGGALQYARRAGGAGYDEGLSVAVDQPTGDVYLSGTHGSASHPTMPNVLVAKYNSAGTQQWQKTAGAGTGWDQGNDVVVTPAGVYVTGYFGGSITFGSTTLLSKGLSDIFVVHYPFAANGTADWAKSFGNSREDKAYSLTYHAWDNGQKGGDLYLSGSFTGTVAFPPLSISATGGALDEDMFVARLAADGTPNWIKRVGGPTPDAGSGNLALRNSNTLYLTGRYTSTVTLGKSTLTGPATLLARIDLPNVNDVQVINATTNADKHVLREDTYNQINYLTLGTDKINLRANVTPGSTGSVKFSLDGVIKTDLKAPFTWAGDLPFFMGGTDYFAFTPSLGEHTLVITPYAGPEGTGVKGLPRTIKFTVVNKPVVAGVAFVNAVTDQDIPVSTSPSDGGEVTLNYTALGTNKINLRANVNPGTVGSVKFVLNGVTKIENGTWPYTWGGDALKVGGFVDYQPVTLPEGNYLVAITAYTGPNATGTASDVYYTEFNVYGGGNFRVAAPASGPEAESLALQVAPNPFTGRTTLSFTATEDAPATLAVYNAQGLPVGRLFEGTLQKGKAYRWQFDGTAQPAGLYVARLKVGHRVLHQRLVLSK